MDQFPATSTGHAKRLYAKIFGLAAGLLAVFPATASQSLSLAWSASSSAGVVGYAVYYGNQSGTYLNRIDAGTNTTLDLTGLTEGATNYFVVKAYTAGDAVESPASNEILYIVPGLISIGTGTNSGTNSSTNLGISFPVAPGHVYQVQASADLQNWYTVWQLTATNNSWVNFNDAEQQPAQFYRLAWQ